MIKLQPVKYFYLIWSAALLFLLLPKAANAQYGNVWAFGTNAGIDFNTTPPQAITTAISTSEGSASVCDSLGHLLFYTDGTSVYDHNNNVMPNGADLPDVGMNITNSTTQGTLIVPKPGSTHQYYVFSMGKFEAETQGYLGKLYYSLIDMNLNNGLGDAVAGSKGILMDSFLTEHMTAVSGNSCNIWLLVISRSLNVFKAYNIDFNGIDFTPVLSNRIPPPAGAYADGKIGTIDIATDRSKIAVTQSNLYVYDFDADSGKLKNPFLLHDGYGYYGVCFSPDNSKLYAGIEYPNTINQFDLSSGDSATMVNSRTLIASGTVFSGAIKRGPDGKVYYCSRANDSALCVIKLPNLAGAACQNVTSGFPLASGTNALFGLPNLAMIANKRKIHHAEIDTAFCYQPFLLSASNLTGVNYLWENGSTDSVRLVNGPGNYRLTYLVNSPCMYDEYTDSFQVIYDNSIKMVITSTAHSGLCKADSFLMTASNLSGLNYVWEDGSTGSQRYTNQTGTYWLNYQIDANCKHYVDSFFITFPVNDYTVSFNADTIVCIHDLVQFQNTSDSHYHQFNWSFGDGDVSLITNPAETYTLPGSYEVLLKGNINAVCFDTASRIIVVDSIYPVSFTMDKTAICLGEAVTLHFTPVAATAELHMDFGDGRAFTFTNEQSITHAYDSAGTLPILLTTHFRACPNISFADTIQVYAPPKVYLGPDSFLCLQGAPIFLKNLLPAPAVAYHSLWNTGDTAAMLKVVHPGIYNLTISTEPLGCSTTETLTINKDCYIDIPNAFTPNGDGVNDYFFPRQLLSHRLTQFSMQLFNRWGQKVFETTATNGRGWDGQLNGKNQPEGVYLYLIEAEIDGQHIEKYQGNVTLIR
jgi:gliding motility-associated-like protein